MSWLVDDFLGNERTTGRLAFDATVKGLLQYGGDEDWFSVSLEAGVTYYLKGACLDAISEFAIAFYDPRVAHIVAATLNEEQREFALEFTPAISGTYYALAADVKGNLFANRTYSLQIAPRSQPDDYAGNSSTSGIVTVATPGHAVFEQLGDVDWFRFHAEAGYRYSFMREGRDSNVPGQGLFSSIDIVDANGYGVETPGMDFNPLTTGDYYIAVAGYQTGAYGIVAKQWQDDFADYAGTKGRLATGGSVQGSIDFEMDQDWMRVDFEKGKTYTFTLRSDHDFVWGMQLIDQAGTHLDYINSFAGSDGLIYSYLAEKTASVFLQVERGLTTRPIDYASPYTVSLAAAADDLGDDAAHTPRFAIGQAANGSLQFRTDRDAFKISLEAGVTYQFGLAAGGGSEYIKLEIASASDSTMLASNMVGAAGSLAFTPVTAGDYIVMVASDGGVKANQAYTLTAARASDDWAANMAGAGPLAVGSNTTTGKLENAGDRDWYAVRLEAGTTYWIGAKSETNAVAFNALLRIVDAAGRTVSSDTLPYDSSPLGFKPDAGGTYYLEISSPGQRTGTYTISAAVGTPDDVGNSTSSATVLALGVAQQGQLEVSSDTDVFRLDVVAGKTYVVETSGPNSYSIGTKLTDASGKALPGLNPAAASDGHYAAFLAETSGAVYAVVQGSAGAYQIQTKVYSDDHPDKLSATVASLSEGGSINGSLEYRADHDVFGIQLDANRTYVLQVKSTTSGGVPPALEFLVDSAYEFLVHTGYVNISAQSVANDVRTVAFTTQTAGQYYLGLGSANQQATSYNVSLLPFAGDGKGPILIAQSHADHAVGVSMVERTITLRFSEAIVIDRDAIVLRDSAGNEVVTEVGKYYPQVKGDTLTIKAACNFDPGTYTLSIPSAAIHDQAGNRYAGPQSITFSTELPVNKPGAGNELYVMTPGAVIDGGEGLDTLSVGHFAGLSSVSRDGDDYYLVDLLDGTRAKFRNIERLIFLDQSYALDVDGTAGQAYRLYQAAFNRTPDKPGLGFWIDQMDRGASLGKVAESFVGSAEFTALYGPGLSDTAFVQTLYQNVLHRGPDIAGLDYWVKALHDHPSRSDVLLHFGESVENKIALAEIIGSGFFYQSDMPF